MQLKGKKIAILVDQIYQDLEVWYPYYRLKEEGADVVVVGAKAGETYHGKYGYPIKTDKSYDEISADQFDAVVIPGGYAPDHIRRHSRANQFVADMDRQGKLVAAICHAGWVLVSAKILKGRRVTGFFAIKDDLENAGAQFEDAEVVIDRNLITSRKPDDLPAFCRAIIEVLAKTPVAQPVSS